MKKALLFIPLCFLGFITKAQDAKELKKISRLDSILTVYSKKDMFNGTVLVAKDGKILLNKGYGYSNYASDIPNTPETKFKLGSLSKQFTSMGILILEEQGKLSVTDKLSKFIPDYPNGDKITLHHILTHTSGIPSITSSPRFDSIKKFHHSLEQMVAYSKPMPLEFEPGSKFNYSNSGYIILSYVIEKASGLTYGEFISKNIFEKLRMKNSGYCYTNAVVKNHAEGYTQSADGYSKCGYIDMSVPQGAGALYSCTGDLYLWDQALYTEKLVKKSTLEKAFKPVLESAGYGWFIEDYHGHKRVYHTGRIEGFSTVINRFTDDNLSLIILKNVDNQTYFSSNKIAMQVLFDEKCELPAERVEAKVDPAIYQKLIGQYELMPGFEFTISNNEGKLFVQATNQPELRLFPESEWKYYAKEVNASIEFIKGEDGNAASLVLSQNGKQLPGKRKVK